ncbi:uncharacterized protein LOC107367449 [Tetranychus urticae]|uniref:uncharacterized protein LOC107367449 n=1 Tax=Tetranychus urticae TaxID=32264 RepID=UPI000356AFB2|nr:uncharacterized protein LOC107367449 [Tetranychus urticae]
MRLFAILVLALVVYSVSGANLGSQNKLTKGSGTKTNSGVKSVSPDKSKNDADESESEKSSNTTVEKYETGKIERLLAEIQELLANAEEGNESEPSKDKPKPQMNKPKPSMNKPKPPCYKPHPRFDFPSHPSASHGSHSN